MRCSRLGLHPWWDLILNLLPSILMLSARRAVPIWAALLRCQDAQHMLYACDEQSFMQGLRSSRETHQSMAAL